MENFASTREEDLPKPGVLRVRRNHRWRREASEQLRNPKCLILDSKLLTGRRRDGASKPSARPETGPVGRPSRGRDRGGDFWRR